MMLPELQSIGYVSDFDPDDDDLSGLGDFTVGKKVQISLADMDVQSWQHDLKGDLALIEELLASMKLIRPEDDAKLQHLKAHIHEKIDSPIAQPGNDRPAAVNSEVLPDFLANQQPIPNTPAM